MLELDSKMKEGRLEKHETASRVRGRRRRRGPHDLIFEILTLAKNGARKTHLMEKVGLSTEQVKRYFDGLKQSGFIAEKSGMWKTTDKGRIAIEACELCRRITREI